MDLRLLTGAYERSAATYDATFRALQRPKYETAARLLGGFRLDPGARCLDAGGGSGLFSEWLEEDDASGEDVRRALRKARVIVLDASLAMLRHARARGLPCVGADLALAPLRPLSFPLVVSFTAVLGEVPRALRSLGQLVAPGGRLVVSFLAVEAPAATLVARQSGLALIAGPAAAGQDRVFVLAQGGSK